GATVASYVAMIALGVDDGPGDDGVAGQLTGRFGGDGSPIQQFRVAGPRSTGEGFPVDDGGEVGAIAVIGPSTGRVQIAAGELFQGLGAAVGGGWELVFGGGADYFTHELIQRRVKGPTNNR